MFVFRFDGFNDAIELGASKLPKGVTCPPQVIGPGQTRGRFVLVADKDAETGTASFRFTRQAGEREARGATLHGHVARGRDATGTTAAELADDYADGPRRRARGRDSRRAPFTLTPTETELTAKPGSKLDVTLKVTRDAKFKDVITIISAAPNIGSHARRGTTRTRRSASSRPTEGEVKLSVDIPNALPPGNHTLVLRGVRCGVPRPRRAGTTRRFAQPTCAALPITVTVEGSPKKK